MNHPAPQTLHAWLDGTVESNADAREIEAHVSTCATCSHEVAGVKALGQGLKAWADDVVPAMDGDVMAYIASRGGNGATHLSSAPPRRVSQVPHTSHTDVGRASDPDYGRHERTRRRILAVSAITFPLLAAAAFVMMLQSRVILHGLPIRTQHVRLHADPLLSRAESLFGRPAVKVAEHRGARGARGTQVMSIDASADHSIYSVIELRSDRDGVTTSVVWIDDPDDFDSASGSLEGAIQ